jgi:hypothetical protein
MKKILAVVAAALVSACSGSDKASDGNSNGGEPNDTIGQATSMTPGAPIVGTITESDLDVYKLTVPTGGATVNIQTFDQGGVDCDPTDEAVDPKIVVYDAAGNKVAESDDSGRIWCEDFDVTLAAGTNYVEVSGWPPIPFVYTLKVSVR